MNANVPSAYKDEYCQLVKDLMEDGSSFAAFRAHVGIASSTFYYWRKQHPEFDEACEVANALSVLWWELQARSAAQTSFKTGAPAVILAGLYNRGTGDWSNKVEVEQKISTEDDKLDLTKLSDEELAAYELVVAARERIKGGDQSA